MLIINGKEINGYEDYQQLNGEDIVAFYEVSIRRRYCCI